VEPLRMTSVPWMQIETAVALAVLRIW